MYKDKSNFNQKMAYKSKDTAADIRTGVVLFIFSSHIFLVLFLWNSIFLPTIYALGIFLVGVLAVFSGNNSLIACVIAYITGAEVLIRMTHAKVFWEFGKYATTGILILALITKKIDIGSRGRINLILYFLLLLPGVWLCPFSPLSLDWRQQVSFNISGPLALCLCGLFFSRLILDRKDLQRIFVWLIAPVVSIAFISGIVLIEAQYTDWGMSSRKVASGLFGPNQVCSILGLAVFLCIVSFVLFKKGRTLKIIFIFLTVWFFTHGLLTLSRGGILGTGAMVIIFLIFIVRTKKNRFVALALGIFLISLIHYYIIPKVDQYTKGFLGKRYMMTMEVAGIKIPETALRFELALADIQAFKNNLLFGEGVGSSYKLHYVPALEVYISPHTEWTRILAEHGIFGIVSIVFLLTWIFKRYVSMKDTIAKAIALCFIFGGIFYMGHSAMRLVMPAFMIGLVGADFKCAE